jgi:hypothetical protein
MAGLGSGSQQSIRPIQADSQRYIDFQRLIADRPRRKTLNEKGEEGQEDLRGRFVLTRTVPKDDMVLGAVTSNSNKIWRELVTI